MNRKAYWSVLAVICMTGLVNCSSKKTPPAETIAETSGTGQSTTVNTAFGAVLEATVTTGTTGTSGVSVTFSAPGSGASGTFAGGGTTAIVPTNSSGVAMSPVFTANGTAGAYTVTATAT